MASFRVAELRWHIPQRPIRQQKPSGMAQRRLAGAIACGQDSACGRPRLSGGPQDGAAPHMIPDRSCIWCLSNIPTRPMARRACRPAIGRLRSPSTSDCVTLGPLGIPHHDMRSPFAADPDACGSCRRPQAPTSTPPRTPAYICPHSTAFTGMVEPVTILGSFNNP